MADKKLFQRKLTQIITEPRNRFDSSVSPFYKNLR